MAIDPNEYEQAQEGVLELILQESDKRVAAQVQLMLAADARATGVLSASIVLAAAGIGYAASKLGAPTPLSWGALVFGLLEALAAFSALWALTPQSIDPQGWAPRTFDTDLKKHKVRIQAEMLKFLQSRIEKNRSTASRLARRIRAALTLAVLGPIAGLFVALVAVGQALSAFLVFLVVAVFLAIALRSFRPPSANSL